MTFESSTSRLEQELYSLWEFIENGCDARPEDKHDALSTLDRIKLFFSEIQRVGTIGHVHPEVEIGRALATALSGDKQREFLIARLEAAWDAWQLHDGDAEAVQMRAVIDDVSAALRSVATSHAAPVGDDARPKLTVSLNMHGRHADDARHGLGASQGHVCPARQALESIKQRAEKTMKDYAEWRSLPPSAKKRSADIAFCPACDKEWERSSAESRTKETP
jgi:hypothetical protein